VIEDRFVRKLDESGVIDRLYSSDTARHARTLRSSG
jgi:hypothetical protein